MIAVEQENGLQRPSQDQLGPFVDALLLRLKCQYAIRNSNLGCLRLVHI